MAAVVRDVRKRLGGERGAELLELAITLPILLVVFAAMIDFAVLFQRYQVVTNAAREGARVGILPDYGTADVQARVNSYLAQSGLTDTAPAPGVNYESVEVTPGGATMTVVRVVVQYPHQFIFLGPAVALVGGGPKADIMLAAAATMRQELAAAP
jgi:Flp pilus assembly protein TadG